MAISQQQKAYLDSFQGKDESVLEDLDESTIRNLTRQGYTIDGTGSSNPNDIDYNPRKNTIVRRGTPSPRPYADNKENRRRYLAGEPLVENPAPPDNSLFQEPVVDPIRITTSTPIEDDIDRDVDAFGNVDLFPDAEERLDTGFRGEQSARVSRADQGTTGQSPSTEAPEEVYGMDDEYDDDGTDFPVDDLDTEDGTETGAAKGLNSEKKSTTKVADSKDAAGITEGPFMEDLSKIEINPRPNELNMFSSYNYNIALYMMNSDSYVDITSSPSTPQDALSPPNSFLLMRSGGVGLDNANTDFFNDFYIDDLEISNVAVGPSKFKQNTNATDIRFTITEPRGVTLLEKLQRLAGQVLANTGEKYIHAPYLLEISFRGYDENGTAQPAPSTPKYIPIRITDMKFEVTAAGTQYQVTAIPFANHAMGAIVCTIPFNVELKAQTVGDIFSSGVVINRVVEERVFDTDFDEEGRITKRTIKEKSKNLGELLTDNQRRRTLPTVVDKDKNLAVEDTEIPPAAEYYDSYEFMLAAEIASARLNIDGLFDALNTPAPTEGNKQNQAPGDKAQFDAYVQGLAGGITLDKATSTFKINAGTDVTKLLNLVILHSDYMDQNVVTNPQRYAQDGNPIKWFKIRPFIKSSKGNGAGYDKKDGRYKYNITFAVEKNNVYYNDFPWAKKSKPVGIGVHKKYDYIYSGLNTEVLDFQLKFNTAFIQVMTAGTGSPFANKDADVITPVVQEVPSSVEGDTINGANTLTRSRAKDLFSSVMSDGVDMIDLNLQILGDPAFIPTSDAYWQDKIRNGMTYTESFMPDGTINYNVSSPFIKVNLRTPTDYDETTGLANPARFGNSSFSGVYQVTSVDSTFSGGIFQQRIEGFRTHLQPTKGGIARTEAATASKERSTAETAASEDANLPDKPVHDFDEVDFAKSGSKARVTDPFDELDGDFEEPYTSPLVNNEITARVAQQPDQTVTYVDEDPTDTSATDAWLASRGFN